MYILTEKNIYTFYIYTPRTPQTKVKRWLPGKRDSLEQESDSQLSVILVFTAESRLQTERVRFSPVRLPESTPVPGLSQLT